MSSLLTISANKKPFRRLPSSIDIDKTSTVEDVKAKIAQRAGGCDPNRLGLYVTPTQMLKDRKAIVARDATLLKTKELLVQDLGMPLCLAPARRKEAPPAHPLQARRSPGATCTFLNTSARW